MVWLALLATVVPRQDVAVLTVGAPPADPHAVVAPLLAPVERLLSSEEVLGRLSELPAPRLHEDLAAVERLLLDARQHEAHFETEAARALWREVLLVQDTTAWPSPELGRLAALALHDLAASALASGDPHEALQLLREAQRRFPDTTLDTTRHPPTVQNLFRTAAEAASPMVTLQVRVDSPARLVVDGTVRGVESTTHVLTLAPGGYRIWVTHGAQRSWPRHVQLTADAELTIAAALEEQLDFASLPTLQCTSYTAVLAHICPKVAPARCMAITQSSAGWVAWSESPTIARPRFDPLWLVPLGVGQWRQDRRLVAGAWATAEVGLLAWHVVALTHHLDVQKTAAVENEAYWRRQRNLSAAALYGTVALGMAEAVLNGLWR